MEFFLYGSLSVFIYAFIGWSIYTLAFKGYEYLGYHGQLSNRGPEYIDFDQKFVGEYLLATIFFWPIVVFINLIKMLFGMIPSVSDWNPDIIAVGHFPYSKRKVKSALFNTIYFLPVLALGLLWLL